MDYDELVDEETFRRIFRMAYRGARAVLMMRRDPSIKQPTDADLGEHLTMLARLLTHGHFEERDLLTLSPILRASGSQTRRSAPRSGAGTLDAW